MHLQQKCHRAQGLSTYYYHFLPHMATTLSPLYTLMHNNVTMLNGNGPPHRK